MKRIMLKLLRAELQRLTPEVLLTPVEIELLKKTETLEALYQMTVPHDLSHMIGEALQHLDVPMDAEWRKKFRFSQISAVQRYENTAYELQRLYAFFEEIEVRYIPLKGTVLRQYYPKPEQRTSCDIDLLISQNDMEKTTDLLQEKLNYRKLHAGSCDVSFVSPYGGHLELHFKLMDERDHSAIAEILETVWEHAVPGTVYPHRYEMKPACEYFYHIAHMAKHFLYGGCGIRTFMDLWVYRQCHTDLDNPETTRLLDEGGLAVFEKNVRNLSDCWFSGIEPENPSLLEWMEEYVLAGGIYGSDDNRVKVRRIAKKNNVQYYFSRLFLPYEQLKYEYPILQKYPVCIPFCHLQRWGRLLSGKTRGRIMNELKVNSEFTDDNQMEFMGRLTELGLK